MALRLTVFGRVVLGVVFVLASPGRDQAHADALADMTAELGRLVAEDRDLAGKAEEFKRLNAAIESESRRLKEWADRLDQSHRALESRRASVESACNVTVPHSQLAAARARCDRLRMPFGQDIRRRNAEVGRYNADADKHRQRVADYRAKAEKHNARSSEVRQRISALNAAVAAERTKQQAAHPRPQGPIGGNAGCGSDITGLGGSPAPSNCPPRMSQPQVRQNVANAKAYLGRPVGSRQTVDTGQWIQAANQLRQIALELGRAGRLAEKQAAEEEAETLTKAAAENVRQVRSNEAETLAGRARAIETLGRSCTDFLAAAQNYYEASRWYELYDSAQMLMMRQRAMALGRVLESAERSGQCDDIRRTASLPRVASGSSAPGQSGASNPDFDCTYKGIAEGAAWDAVCLPHGGPRTASDYRPTIPPQALFIAARELCRSAPVEVQRACITRNKVMIVLDRDPKIRAKCGSVRGEAELIECVDRAYVYGPKTTEADVLREQLRSRIAALKDVILPPARQPQGQVPPPPRTGCPPGTGLKPTPGGFGGTSCQPLGGFAAPAGAARPNVAPAGVGGDLSHPAGGGHAGGLGASGAASDPSAVESMPLGAELAGVGSYRTTSQDAGPGPEALDAGGRASDALADDASFSQAAGAAAAAAAEALGKSMSEQDRATCAMIAYEAARSILSGGTAQVPALCSAIAEATRINLAYHAAVGIDGRPERPDENLLEAYLNLSNPKTGVRNSGAFDGPAFFGIEPTPEQRREMDELLRRDVSEHGETGEVYGPPLPKGEIYGPPKPD